MSHDEVHDDLQDCIEECLNCHAVCTLTAQHCLVKGGDHASIDLVGVLLDCAEICQASANFMLRGSPYHVVTCAACAELCRACEEACRVLEDDEQLASCADVCAACAASCSAMAEHAEQDEVKSTRKASLSRPWSGHAASRSAATRDPRRGGE